MVQIVSISKARNNLSKLVDQVKTTKNPVLIVQDSDPAVVLYPYERILEDEQLKEQMFQDQFEDYLKEGKQIFGKYLKDKKIKKKLSEEEAYKLIKNG